MITPTPAIGVWECHALETLQIPPVVLAHGSRFTFTLPVQGLKGSCHAYDCLAGSVRLYDALIDASDKVNGVTTVRRVTSHKCIEIVGVPILIIDTQTFVLQLEKPGAQ